MNTNTEIKPYRERGAHIYDTAGRAIVDVTQHADAEITDLRAESASLREEIARLQAELNGSNKRVRSLEILVDAYGPKSLQYDIEHPCDGLNALPDRDAKQVQGEREAFEKHVGLNFIKTRMKTRANIDKMVELEIQWQGWQARAALAQRVGCEASQPPADAAPVEAVPEMVYQILDSRIREWVTVPKGQYDRCNPEYRRTYEN